AMSSAWPRRQTSGSVWAAPGVSEPLPCSPRTKWSPPTTGSTGRCSMPDSVPHESVSFLVFSDDWGRHPSSCQHLFRQLLPRYRTFWVNTIGMRRPRFDLATLRRDLEKLLHWTRRSPVHAALPDNLHVSNPRMWPWFSTSFDRRLNCFLLAR